MAKEEADDAAFAALETEFAGVLEQMQADPALAAFRAEYEKLHAALLKSHQSERRLMAKCREVGRRRH